MKAGQELDELIAEKVFGVERHEKYGITLMADMNYSTDIGSAWQVFEWLQERGIVKLSNGDGDSRDVDYFAKYADGTKDAHATADTYPMAICLAALEAVGYKDENK